MQALKIVVGIGFTVLLELQTIQVHHFIDISKGSMDTRNMFVLKHLGYYAFLLRDQCGEKFIFRLIVLLHFRLTVGRTGQETKKWAHSNHLGWEVVSCINPSAEVLY